MSKSKEPKAKKIDILDKGQKALFKDMIKGLKKQSFDVAKSPEYQESLKQLRGVSDYTNELMGQSPEAYQRFKDPMMQEYQQQIMPGIMERMGALGNGNSSALNQTLAQSGQSLSDRLSAMRAQMQSGGAELQSNNAQAMYEMGMAPYKMNMRRANTALGQQTMGFYEPGQTTRAPGGFSNFLSNVLPSVGQAAVQGISNYFQPSTTNRQMYQPTNYGLYGG